MMACEQHRQSSARLPLLVLFALFVVALLIVLITGVSIYKSIVDADSESDAHRFSVGLLENSIKAADSYSSVHLGNGPEGRSIVLVEYTDAGVFETRIYQFDGAIYQESALESAPYDPIAAMKIVDSDTFDVSMDGSLISIKTDDGEAAVALRSDVGEG